MPAVYIKPCSESARYSAEFTLIPIHFKSAAVELLQLCPCCLILCPRCASQLTANVWQIVCVENARGHSLAGSALA